MQRGVFWEGRGVHAVHDTHDSQYLTCVVQRIWEHVPNASGGFRAGRRAQYPTFHQPYSTRVIMSHAPWLGCIPALRFSKVPGHKQRKTWPIYGNLSMTHFHMQTNHSASTLSSLPRVFYFEIRRKGCFCYLINRVIMWVRENFRCSF